MGTMQGCVICGREVSYEERLPVGEPVPPIARDRVVLHIRCGATLAASLALAMSDRLSDLTGRGMVHYRTCRPALSPREQELLHCLCRGGTNDDIAREMGLSSKTVRKYITQIFVKLGAKNRTEAALIGLRRGLVDDLREIAS